MRKKYGLTVEFRCPATAHEIETMDEYIEMEVGKSGRAGYTQGQRMLHFHFADREAAEKAKGRVLAFWAKRWYEFKNLRTTIELEAL